LSSILISLAVVPILLSARRMPRYTTPSRVPPQELYRISPLGVLATFGAGVVQSGAYSTSGVFAARSELAVSQTSLFVLLLLLSGVAAQFPIGTLSDRFDRRRVLTAVFLLGGVVGLLAGLVPTSAVVPLLLVTALYGGLLMPIYSLAIAHTNDYLDPDQTVAASGSLILIYGVGSVFGPVLLGQLIDQTGPASFFVANGVIMLLVGSFALYRMTRRAARPLEEQGEYVQISPTVSSATAASSSSEDADGAPPQTT
ncbi:MAG: MFS transporter, partial [Candidatus Competibacterales bacterium]|nr:MFS transporter [Candidatus Competibacterales bacterium]